jgi:hypothetical protein
MNVYKENPELKVNPLKHSDHYVCHYTSVLILHFTHSVFLVFEWFTEETGITSIYRIKRPGFVVEIIHFLWDRNWSRKYYFDEFHVS